MADFTATVNNLIELATSADAQPEEMQEAAQTVCASISTAGPAELDAGLMRLADTIASAEMPGASVAAICCGAIVEKGGNPEIALEATLGRLEEALTYAQLFAEACEEMAADDDDRIPEDGEETDDDDPIEKFGEEVASRMPENARAFNAVESLGMGAIAMLSHSPTGRKRGLAQHPNLAGLAGDLAPYHERAHYLAKICDVLDNEHLLVLHPGEKKGYRVRLSGIGTNFELFILMADALIGDPAQGWLPGKKPDPDVVAACQNQPAAAARGKTAEGAFNFYNWSALRSDGTLPDPGDYSSSKDWIWMEGIPADIADFEGQRVILLGPPPYARVLRPGRCFEGMTAGLHVEATLSAAEVQQWLTRLSAAIRDETG